MDISLITIVVLAFNIVIMLFAAFVLKNATDWLKALDDMMAGKSKKAKCVSCGRIYRRDTSLDLCDACKSIFNDHRHYGEAAKGVIDLINEREQSSANDIRNGVVRKDGELWNIR